jgi:hypothetical protein
VITTAVGDHFLCVTLDAMETRLVLGVLGVTARDVAHVSVTIVRSPLDLETLHAKSSEALRDASADTGDLFECGDVDHNP